MADLITCPVCQCPDTCRIDIQSVLFPVISSAPAFHSYDYWLCARCNVAFMWPQPAEETLSAHYQTDYRASRYALDIDGNLLDMPLQMPSSILSFQRFQTFYDCIKRNEGKHPGLLPTGDDWFIDYGGYQGLFLYGVSHTWGSHCVVYDYAEAGVEFAKKAFGFQDSCITRDIATDTFGRRFDFVTLLQVFEHLREPERVLRHIKNNVIAEDGYLFIEVPNLYGFPLSDPVHLFTYTVSSLPAMLRRCGFEVIDCYTDGFPPSGDGFDNPERKVVCLARPGPAEPDDWPEVNPAIILQRMRRLYRQHSWASLRRSSRSLGKQVYGVFYAAVHLILLERLFPRSLFRVKKMLKSLFFRSK